MVGSYSSYTESICYFITGLITDHTVTHIGSEKQIIQKHLDIYATTM